LIPIKWESYFKSMNLEDYRNHFRDELHLSRIHARHILKNDLSPLSVKLDNLPTFEGKSLRALILFLFSDRAGARCSDASFFAACIELLHLASLIHDDVIDDADKRRGKPSVPAVFGKKLSVLTGDFICTRVFREIGKHGRGDFLDLFLEKTCAVIEGEMAQTLHAETGDMTEEDYIALIDKKTGSFFELAAIIGVRLAGKDALTENAAKQFGRFFGRAFQVVDDLLDLSTENVDSGKAPFSDIKNDVMTLPMIHFIRLGNSLDEFRCRCQAGAYSDAVLRLQEAGSLDYAFRCASDWMDRALLSVTPILPAPLYTRLSFLCETTLCQLKEGVLDEI